MLSPRHSGSRGTETSRWRWRDARHLGQRVLGIGHVLEHLDRRRQVELAVGERQLLGAHRPELEVRPLALGPLGGELRVLEVDPDHAPLAQALRPTARSARPRRSRRRAPRRGRLRRTARRACARSRPSAARRPGCSSRTCRRCCRDGTPAAAWHRRSRSSYAVLRSGSRGRRSGRGGRRPLRRPARSARARPRAAARSGGRARRCAARACAARRAGRRSRPAPRAASRR